MPLLFFVILQRSKTKSRESNFVSDYREQRCQITEVVFYTKVLVNDILVGLERILDYAGVGLERFNCTKFPSPCYYCWPDSTLYL